MRSKCASAWGVARTVPGPYEHSGDGSCQHFWIGAHLFRGTIELMDEIQILNVNSRKARGSYICFPSHILSNIST